MNADMYKAKRHYQNQEVASSYDAERFSNWIGRMAHEGEARALQEKVDKYCKEPGTVLDIPCGTGRLFPVLLAKGHQIIGADISEDMMAVAKKRFETYPKVKFQKADAEQLPFHDNQFDYATSFRLLCHLPADARERVVREMVRVTKKILIINYHVKVYTPLYLFNRLFRKSTCPPFPMTSDDLTNELKRIPGVRVLETSKLSWYDRSSTLVVFEKLS